MQDLLPKVQGLQWTSCWFKK